MKKILAVFVVVIGVAYFAPVSTKTETPLRLKDIKSEATYFNPVRIAAGIWFVEAVRSDENLKLVAQNLKDVE